MRLRAEKKALGKNFRVVDSHTMGEPTRVIYDGFPELHGSTMMERKEYLEAHYDHYRRALMLEPRGHRDMFGALLTEPVSPEADLGVIFMDSGGLPEHVRPREHRQRHGGSGNRHVGGFRALHRGGAGGPCRTHPRPGEGGARPGCGGQHLERAFLYRENLSLALEEYGTVPFDIAFGGG